MTREDDPIREQRLPRLADIRQTETSLLTPPLKAAWLEGVAPPRDGRARLWTELATTTRAGTLSETVARVDRAMRVRALGAPLAQLRHGLLAKWIVTGVLLTGVLAAVLIARPRVTPAPSAARAITPHRSGGVTRHRASAAAAQRGRAGSAATAHAPQARSCKAREATATRFTRRREPRTGRPPACSARGTACRTHRTCRATTRPG